MLGLTTRSAWTESKWDIFPHLLTSGSVMRFAVVNRTLADVTQEVLQSACAEVGLVSLDRCLHCENIPRLAPWAEQEDDGHTEPHPAESSRPQGDPRVSAVL